MKELENKIRDEVSASGDFDFPGFKLQSYYRGKKVVDLTMGNTYKYYDFASLTKIIFTSLFFVEVIAKKKISLATPLTKVLPWYPHKKTNVSQLLNHSAGNNWWQPFYKKINPDLDKIQKYQQLETLCREVPLKKSHQAIYSDIDFFLLGSVMQNLSERPLLDLWNLLKNKYYLQSQLHFNSDNKLQFRVEDYAETEKCSWRKRTLKGEVHDENAWALGGVAPHAGLFGRIEDLSDYGLFLRKLYRSETSFAVNSTFKRFVSRSLPKSRGDWGYGFMLPSQKNSSAGDFFHGTSFGHTGFTGTSLWYDPKKDLLVSILSNRVHPSRNQKGFVRLRPKIHNWIVQYMKGSF